LGWVWCGGGGFKHDDKKEAGHQAKRGGLKKEGEGTEKGGGGGGEVSNPTFSSTKNIRSPFTPDGRGWQYVNRKGLKKMGDKEGR
jgi:hypothetical protein